MNKYISIASLIMFIGGGRVFAQAQLGSDIDGEDATGYTVTAGTPSDYKLLSRAETSGDFSILASGSSTSGDAVTFSSVSLSDEYLAIGQATDSDAYLSVPICQRHQYLQASWPPPAIPRRY